jgi:hypothetical protein
LRWFGEGFADFFFFFLDRILENVVSSQRAGLRRLVGAGADGLTAERDVDRDSGDERQEGKAGEQGQVHQQDVSQTHFDG